MSRDPCSRCGCVLPLTSYYFKPDKRSKNGFAAECKACRGRRERLPYKADPVRANELMRHRRKAHARNRRKRARNTVPMRLLTCGGNVARIKALPSSKSLRAAARAAGHRFKTQQRRLGCTPAAVASVYRFYALPSHANRGSDLTGLLALGCFACCRWPLAAAAGPEKPARSICPQVIAPWGYRDKMIFSPLARNRDYGKSAAANHDPCAKVQGDTGAPPGRRWRCRALWALWGATALRGGAVRLPLRAKVRVVARYGCCGALPCCGGGGRCGSGPPRGLVPQNGTPARIGLSAMDVCRPLPFLAAERPQLKDLTGDLVKLREATGG